MRRVILLLVLPLLAWSQHVQLHYDFGQERHYFTSTLEMFKADECGAWFWFVDVDYNSDKNSAGLAYWEIARYFTLPVLKNKLSFKIEYNDGLFLSGGSAQEGYLGAPIYGAWLTGVGYNFDLVSVNIQTDLLCRFIPVSDFPDWQLTVVWSRPFANFLLVGYFDLWTQDLYGSKEWIFQSEPQIWYMMTDRFGVGGEVEISRALLFDLYGSAWKAMPTLGVRWNF